MNNSHIIITNYSDKNGYVFVSYSSRNKETVINDFLIPLQQEHGLRIYFDEDFQNDATRGWTEQMRLNLSNSQACIIFLSSYYLRSYACLLELLSAIVYEIPILVIRLEDGDIYKKTKYSNDITEPVKVSQTTKNSFEKLEAFFSDPEGDLLIRASEIYHKVIEAINSNKLAPIWIVKYFKALFQNIDTTRIDGRNCNGDTLRGIKNSIEKAKHPNNPMWVFSESKSNTPVAKPIQQNTTVPAPEKNNAVHTPKTDVSKPPKESVTDNEQPLDEKIGQFVKKSMKKLQDEGYQFTDEMFANLFDAEYSKKMFHSKYPLFIDDESKIHDKKGHNRYWVTPFYFNGKTLYISSQWFKHQRTFFETWYHSLTENADITSETDDESSQETNDKNIFDFSVYGEKFTGNQNVFMQRVFEKVMRKHENIVNKLIDAKYMSCLSRENLHLYRKSETNCFRCCEYYPDIADGVSVGTAYNKVTKAQKIACVLLHCGEPLDIIRCDNESVMNEIKTSYEYYSGKISAIQPDRTL